MRFAALLAVAACGDPAPATFWISPAGSDDAAGTEAAPFATLARARDAIRSVRPTHAIVYLRGGRYELAETFALEEQDSNITFAAAPNEHPVVSGGVVVAGWQPGPNDTVVASVDVDDFRQLWIDGALAPRARGPAPSLTVAGDVDNIDGVAGYIADKSFAFANPGALEFGYTTTWSHKICGVARATRIANGVQIDMEQPCFYLITHDAGGPVDTPVYVENALELVDEANEWYFERATRTLHLRSTPPREAIVPVLEQLVVVRGARSIRFEGITFADASWLRPSTYGHPDVQANFVLDGRDRANLVVVQNGLIANDRYAYWKSPAAVVVSGTDDVVFHRCTFTRLGGAGLDVERGARNTRIEGNRFTNIAANGIQIGDVLPEDHHPTRAEQVVRDNTVVNNVIRDIGLQYEDSVGVFVGFTDHTVIAHNDLSRMPYTAISVGWGWGDLDAGGHPMRQEMPWRYDTPTACMNNKIVANEIYDIMRRRSDGGGVYTIGVQRGTVISGNHIYDAANWPGGVYLDQGTGFVEVVANSVHDVPDPYYTGNVVPETLATCNEHDNHFGVAADVGAGLQPPYRDLR